MAKLKKGEKVYRFNFINRKGKKVDRIIITRAPSRLISRSLNNLFKKGEPIETKFNLSRIRKITARRLIKKSRVRNKRVSRQKIGRFNSRSRGI